MTQDIFTIQYPQISVGTEKTDIIFYSSPELDSLMSFLSPNDGLNRIFVTDSTIISLPSLKVLAKEFLISAETLATGIPPRSVFGIPVTIISTESEWQPIVSMELWPLHWP